MLPGPTLDWVSRLAERERPGMVMLINAKTLVALGAQRSLAPVKGSIARALWRAACPDLARS
ncbi:MAG: hypothetical protein ACRDHW_01170 [Ktedonobacteraceae bacterium]